ncbi:MAG: HNH endonuclease [Saprospiraceae bacterium]|nr:HNH endonuclease [Saprospiraceae bacterium]
MEKRVYWTRDEFILTLNLYLKLPFGQLDKSNKEVIALANLVGRTPGSIAMRLVTYASVDPFQQQRGIKGLTGGKKTCEEYFNEFINDRENLMFESEKILAKYQGLTIEQKFESELVDIKNYAGETKERLVKTRINQNLFRKIVLSAYSNKCAISGINIPEFLIASHIKRWSDDIENRLNPSNGICLNSLYDKAFDKGFIGIDTDYKIIFADKLIGYSKEEYFINHFKAIENKKIDLPDRFLPDQNFIQFHLENYFNK